MALSASWKRSGWSELIWLLALHTSITLTFVERMGYQAVKLLRGVRRRRAPRCRRFLLRLTCIAANCCCCCRNC